MDKADGRNFRVIEFSPEVILTSGRRRKGQATPTIPTAQKYRSQMEQSAGRLKFKSTEIALAKTI